MKTLTKTLLATLMVATSFTVSAKVNQKQVNSAMNYFYDHYREYLDDQGVQATLSSRMEDMSCDTMVAFTERVLDKTCRNGNVCGEEFAETFMGNAESVYYDIKHCDTKRK